MPFGYTTAPGATVTTHGTPNSEVDHLRLLTGAARGARISGIVLGGKGAALTAISGIVIRLKRYATASTAGSAITPQPKEPSASAAVLTAFTGPTVGATPTLAQIAFCGAAGPGGWVARDDHQKIVLEAGGGAKGNLDLHSASATASLDFEYALEHTE